MTATAETSPLVDIVRRMKDAGFPMRSIAETNLVALRTVYRWLDGTVVPTDRQTERFLPVFAFLDASLEGDFHLLFRVMRAKGKDGISLEFLLSRPVIDVDAVRTQLGVLSTSISSIRIADARKRSRPFSMRTGANGAVDNMPVAVFEDL